MSSLFVDKLGKSGLGFDPALDAFLRAKKLPSFFQASPERLLKPIKDLPDLKIYFEPTNFKKINEKIFIKKFDTKLFNSIYSNSFNNLSNNPWYNKNFYDRAPTAFEILRRAGVIQGADDEETWKAFINGTGSIDPELLRAGLQLLRIEFQDGGDSTSTTSFVAFSFIESLPPLKSEQLPAPLPEHDVLDMPGSASASQVSELNQLLSSATLHKVLGRTQAYKVKTDSGDMYLGFKFLKHGEEVDKLKYESEFFDYLNKLKKEGVDLIGTYPHALTLGGKRVVMIKEKDLPKALKENLHPDVMKIKTWKEKYYVLMAYATDDPGYFTYLHELGDDTAGAASQVNIHDLFTLARYEVIHPDVIELFHNMLQHGRADGGRYLWDVDIIRPMLTRFGAGRLHNWEKTVEYPNYGASCVRDFAEAVTLDELMPLEHPHSSYMEHNLSTFPEDSRKKALLMHFMGNYLLSWALVEGKRLKKLGKLDAENMVVVEQNLARTIREVYSTAFEAYTGIKDEEIATLIDWDMAARQMLFFMGSKYKSYGQQDLVTDATKKDFRELPFDVFGKSNVRINPGDGWGFIKSDVIGKELAISSEKLDACIEMYFDKAKSSRSISPDLYVFKADFSNLIRREKDEELKQKLIELHKNYSTGWRFDGAHEDLGPVNGPIPLQELIKANYVYTMFMLAAKTRQEINLASPLVQQVT